MSGAEPREHDKMRTENAGTEAKGCWLVNWKCNHENTQSLDPFAVFRLVFCLWFVLFWAMYNVGNFLFVVLALINSSVLPQELRFVFFVHAFVCPFSLSFASQTAAGFSLFSLFLHPVHIYGRLFSSIVFFSLFFCHLQAHRLFVLLKWNLVPSLKTASRLVFMCPAPCLVWKQELLVVEPTFQRKELVWRLVVVP